MLNLFNRKRSTRLFISVVIVAVLAGAGVVSYKINTQLNKEIYGTPRGEIENRTPQDLGLPYEKIRYSTDNDKKIKGWFIPNDNSSSCIILSPGKGSTKWNILKYAPFLHQDGYNVMLFDARGRGESEGERWGFGYFQSRDIIHGIDFLQNEYGIEKFGLLGRSAGATASLVAATNEPEIDAVVFDSGFATIKMASMSYGDYQSNKLFQVLFPLYTFGARLSLGVNVNGKTNLVNNINNEEFAAFFIHGAGDEVILPKNSEVLYEKKTEEKQIWLPEGVKHVEAFDDYPEEYTTRVLDFFHSYL